MSNGAGKAQGTKPVISFGTEANNLTGWELVRNSWIEEKNRHDAMRLQTRRLLDELEARLGVETIGPVRDMLIEQDVDLEATRREELRKETFGEHIVPKELSEETLQAGLEVSKYKFDELEDIKFTARYPVRPVVSQPLGVFTKDTQT